LEKQKTPRSFTEFGFAQVHADKRTHIAWNGGRDAALSDVLRWRHARLCARRVRC